MKGVSQTTRTFNRTITS